MATAADRPSHFPTYAVFICEKMPRVFHAAPRPSGGEEVLMLRRWLEDHFRFVRAFLLILAGLNLWISYTIFSDHPVMATANAVMAVALAWGVILSWGTYRSP